MDIKELVKCPQCGKPMHINHDMNSFPNYVCASYGFDTYPRKCSLVISVREYEARYLGDLSPLERIEKKLNSGVYRIDREGKEAMEFLLSTIKSLQEEVRTCKARFTYIQDERDKYKEANERFVKIFEKMVSGDVWMTYDDNPVDAYKELARHAIKNISQSALKE